MIRKLPNMVDVYESMGRRYDYMNRILASFAEIYNFDYTKSSLMETIHEKESIRPNGVIGRIRAFYETHLNELGLTQKMFYNEVVLDEIQRNEYGYFSFGDLDVSMMAEMISLAVRILEACGLSDIVVSIDAQSDKKEQLYSYFDVLDINYEEKEIDDKFTTSVSFEIRRKMENGKSLSLIQGGDFSHLAEEMSGLRVNVFGFYGSLENLIEVTNDSLSLDDKMLDIVVTYGNQEELEHAMYLTQELRLNGFKTEMIPRHEKSFIKKNYNTKYVISVKEEDIKNDMVTVTDLYTNEKETMKELDLVNHLDLNF